MAVRVYLSLVGALLAASLAGCAASGWHSAEGRTLLIERKESDAETTCAALCRRVARPGEIVKDCYDVEVSRERRDFSELNGLTQLLACVLP